MIVDERGPHHPDELGAISETEFPWGIYSKYHLVASTG
ncbi:MAG: hypothetical protein QOD36_2885 [Mycobacterium sp.]|jgi:hypothetical protein|nr:hypothetical protein [Mycobacterium sp.]